jgi:hypothetical protein
VSNNTLATAAVLSGLHNLLHANSWRLLLGLRTFAADVNDKYSTQLLPAAAAGGSEHGGLNGVGAAAAGRTDANGANASANAAATDAELQLAANTGLLKVAAAAAAETAAADAAGAKNVLAAAATAATAALTTAVANKMGVGAAEVASKLAKDVLDDDTIWAAVWLRRKEMAVIQAAAAQAAAAQAAQLAAVEATADVARGAAKPSAAAGSAAGGSGKGLQQGDAEMPDAADGATQQQQQLAGQANGDEQGSQNDAANAEGGDEAAEGGEEPAAKKKVKLPKVLADMVEALTAAVYVDSGGDWGATWRAVSHLLLMHEGVMQELQLVLPEQKEGQQQQQQQEPDGEAEDVEEQQ